MKDNSGGLNDKDVEIDRLKTTLVALNQKINVHYHLMIVTDDEGYRVRGLDFQRSSKWFWAKAWAITATHTRDRRIDLRPSLIEQAILRLNDWWV